MRSANQVFGTLSDWAKEGLEDLLYFAEARCEVLVGQGDNARTELKTLGEVIETLAKLGVPMSRDLAEKYAILH